jgi:hypothetical protein
MASMQFEELLDDRAAAKVLNLKNPQTLAVWRATRRYALPYVQIGRNIRYRPSDLLNFINSRTVTPSPLVA